MAPDLCLMREDAPQREHSLREVFNALRWIVRAGAPWRLLPKDLPPWRAVCQQGQRWMAAGCFEPITHDLRSLLRLLAERPAEPSAAVLDARTLSRAAWKAAQGPAGTHTSGAKAAKAHIAVDTLGHLLALHVTPANEQERAQVGELAALEQELTGETVELAYVDEGCTGEKPAQHAAAEGH